MSDMSTPTAIAKWFDTVTARADVKGAIIIDARTGFSMGTRGIAEDSDAPHLYLARDSFDDQNRVIVELKHKHMVILQAAQEVIVGIYSDLPDVKK